VKASTIFRLQHCN